VLGITLVLLAGLLLMLFLVPARARNGDRIDA
jgi:hypothetical protein